MYVRLIKLKKENGKLQETKIMLNSIIHIDYYDDRMEIFTIDSKLPKVYGYNEYSVIEPDNFQEDYNKALVRELMK